MTLGGRGGREGKRGGRDAGKDETSAHGENYKRSGAFGAEFNTAHDPNSKPSATSPHASNLRVLNWEFWRLNTCREAASAFGAEFNTAKERRSKPDRDAETKNDKTRYVCGALTDPSMSLRYAEYPPPPELAAVVECFWILEGAGSAVAEPILPDGRTEWLFHYGTPFSRLGSDGHLEQQPRALLAGQITMPVFLAASESAGVAAIRLRPGASNLIGVPAVELTDHLVPFDAFRKTGAVLDQLVAATSDAERLVVLQRWLGPLLNDPPRPAVSHAVDLIVTTGGKISMAALSARANLSRRQMQRLFLIHVGLTPKTLARIVRVQRAAALLRSGAALVDVAIASGYYDQAHMALDFRAVAQHSPGAWQRGAGDLAPLFLSQ
jgi:AraC-like DNA-binding protein